MVAVRGATVLLLVRPTTEPSAYEYLGYCNYGQTQIPFEDNEAAFEGQVLKEFIIV
jgi:hypothetical protein